MSAYLSRLEEFKKDLACTESGAIADKYLFSEGSVILGTKRETLLRDTISAHYKISATNIHVVGSAKLGFTIKPGDRFRSFGNTSDIDIVIVSEEMFELVWLEAFHFWNCGAYWNKREEFEHYLFRGWIRPDKLPPSEVFKFTKEWNRFFRELTSSGTFGRYPIKAGLYSRLSFAKSYHNKCIDSCRENLQNQSQ